MIYHNKQKSLVIFKYIFKRVMAYLQVFLSMEKNLFILLVDIYKIIILLYNNIMIGYVKT